METINKDIALVGLGYWGKNLLRNLHELGALRTACDTVPAAIEERKKQFPDVNYTTSYEAILADPGVKAVALATSAETHYDMVKAALMSGKDVYVEKPLALTIENGRELVRIAAEQGRILMVGHILQYHPAVIKLKEMIANGELGKVRYIYSNRLNIGKLRTEENILWSFAPHDISVILHLLGEEPSSVHAFGGDYINKGIYDTTVTVMEFSNGVKGHIFVSWLNPFKEQKLVIVGSTAMAVFDDVSKEKLFIYPHDVHWQDGRVPQARKAEGQTVELTAKEPLKEELLHFIRAIKDRTKPLTDGEEGLRVLRVLELAEVSLLKAKSAAAKKDQGYFVHETAIVDENVRIGSGSKIWQFSHILKNTTIGKDSVVGQNVCIGPDVTIGEHCKVQNNVSIYKGVELEDGVFCGPSCVFTNVYNPRAFIERKNEFLPTKVGKGATIGANSTIVCGTSIGRYAVIGAGAVVKKDVPAYAVVAGVPARRVGWACKCGVSLRFRDDHGTCSRCGNRYAMEDDKFTIIKEGA